MRAAFRSLARRPVRTALAAAGVAIGTAAYLVIVSSAENLTRHLGERLAATGAELSVRQAGVGMAVLSRIREGDLPRIRAAAGARSVTGVLVQTTRPRGGRQLPVFGLPPEDPVAGLFALRAGRWLGARGGEVVVGRALAERNAIAPGARLEVLPGRGFVVTGVCETGNEFLDSGCALRLEDAQELFGMPGLVSLVLVKLDDPARVPEAIEGVRRGLPHLHATASELFFDSLHEMESLRRWSASLGLAVLAVSALGVAAVVGRNVAEREGEAALLRALGWSRARVTGAFLLDGAVLAAAGGAAGTAMALASLRLAAAAGLSPWVAASLPARVVLPGAALLAAAVLAGTLGALVRPLRRRPADALREP